MELYYNLTMLSVFKVIGEPMVAVAGVLTNLYCMCKLSDLSKRAKNAVAVTQKQAFIWCTLNIVMATLDLNALTLIFGDYLGHSGLCRLASFMRILNIVIDAWMIVIFLLIILSPYKRFPYAPHLVVLVAAIPLIGELVFPSKSLRAGPQLDICMYDKRAKNLILHFFFVDQIPCLISFVLLIMIANASMRKHSGQARSLTVSLIWLTLLSFLSHLPFWFVPKSSHVSSKHVIVRTFYIDLMGYLFERMITWEVVPLLVMVSQTRFVLLSNSVVDDILSAQDPQLVLVELDELEQPTFNLSEVKTDRSDL